MGYAVGVSSDQDTVVAVTYSGAVTIEQRVAALQDVLLLLNDRSFSGVLVDFEHGWVVPAPFDANNRHAANLASAYRNFRGLRIAYVSVLAPNSVPIVETLAAARGFFYERFQSKKLALQWIVDRQR